MKINNKAILFVLIFFIVSSLYSQEIIKNNFRSPIGIPILLSGNFGELRSNHFHSGLDIKTNGKINYRIYAIEDGFVSRINISHWGYGKAIYVDHPNGYTSVYAHLNHFPPKIEKLIRAHQYESKSEIITYYPDSGLINVKKGDVIAYSGNSGGSSGPHLHFEIRNTLSEHPINPQLFGFDIQDNRPPVINKLKIYNLSSSTVNGKCENNEFKLKKTRSGFKLLEDSILNIHGKFGIGISAVDYYNKTYNKCGVYSIKVNLDNKVVFDHKIDELDFETTKQINIYKDYKAYKNRRESIHKVYIHPQNKLLFYNNNLGDGTIKLDDTIIHKIEVVVSDLNTNSSRLTFYVKNNNVNLCRSSTSRSLKDNTSSRLLTSKDSNYLIFIDSNSLYDIHEIKVEMDQDNVLHVASNDIPVREKFSISLKIKDKSILNNDKWLLALIDKRGKIKNRRGVAENGWVKSKVKQFGDFQLMIDTISPKINAIFQPEKIMLNQVLKFKVTDDLSGLEDYQVTINGKWVLSNYNYKSSTLEVPLDSYAGLDKKYNECIILLKDERNNETKYSFDFSLY